MLALILVIIVAAIVAGGFGLAFAALHWLFWVALVVLVVALVYGITQRVFTRTNTRP